MLAHFDNDPVLPLREIGRQSNFQFVILRDCGLGVEGWHGVKLAGHALFVNGATDPQANKALASSQPNSSPHILRDVNLVPLAITEASEQNRLAFALDGSVDDLRAGGFDPVGGFKHVLELETESRGIL